MLRVINKTTSALFQNIYEALTVAYSRKSASADFQERLPIVIQQYLATKCA